MTVSSTTNREQYATDGVTAAFTIHFPFFNDTDINAILVDSGGSSTTLVINTDFTVTGGGGAGGTLTTAGALSPLANGGTLTIYREIPFTQEDDYVEDDPLPADTLEGGFDRAVMRDQQLKDSQDRALTFPVTVAPGVSGELPIPIGDYFLRFSSDGRSIVASPIASLGAVGQATESVAGIAKIATQAITNAGTNDTDPVTPKKLANGTLAASVAANAAAIAALVIRKPVPIRQTVLSGPVDANGLPNFGGSTGGTTLTVAGTLTLTAANGEDANGQLDQVWQLVNPQFTGLSTNGQMYLYSEVNPTTGVATVGATTIAPVYQPGGAYATANGAFTFNTQEMVGKVGNGSAATQTYRVFIGEVTVSGGVVSAIIWYALKGRYLSAFTQNLPGTSTVMTFNHNIGTTLVLSTPTLILECTTNDDGYVVGERIVVQSTGIGSTSGSTPLNLTLPSRNTARFTTQATAAFAAIPAAAGGLPVALTQNSWKYAVSLSRGW